MKKDWYKSKTIWVSILELLTGAGGLLATFLEAGDYTEASIVLLVTGILGLVLRKLTTQPLS
jgi:hypothetical protein